MRRPRLRALVLTAGFGRRLRPLTGVVPKPLLPICGEAVAGHTLRALAELGCEVAALNLHHLGDAVSAYFGRSYFGMPLVYSPESEILGTAGALVPLRGTLGPADEILVVNGDTFCRWPWRRLLSRHRRRRADATLLVHRSADPKTFGGGVGLDRSGRIVQLRDAPPLRPVRRRRVFAGAQILSPRLLDRLSEGPADLIAELYTPLLREGGRLEVVDTNRRWFDAGTPDRYLAAVLRSSEGRWWRRTTGWVSPLAEVHPEAVLRWTAVERDASVAAGAYVERSVLLPGSRVGAGSRLRDSIVGPGVVLAASVDMERRMVNRVRAGQPVAPQESVVGDLVYTPIAADAVGARRPRSGV